MKAKELSLLIGLLLTAGLCQAQAQVEGAVEYGLLSGRIDNPQPGERLLTRADIHLEATDQVPARLGSRFGLRFALTGKADNELPLTLLYLTPGVVTPDGVRHDRFEVVQKLVPGAPHELMAFEFSEPYEVVPGEWRFLVFQGDRKLAEQRFQVQ
ncbi:MAG: DUF3859 domain-containing protein [Pseudomonas sp.]|uniref:DUF3859 domain-containing protein n=1 Tax=Pseudomonas sp. TaxID=306 RepID=UPI00339A5766